MTSTRLSNYTFTVETDYDDEFFAEPVLTLDSELLNDVIGNTLTYTRILNFPMYAIYDRKRRIHAYGMDEVSFQKAFPLRTAFHVVPCKMNDEFFSAVVLDARVFEKIYNSSNTGLQMCMAQLTIFANDANIKAKCQRRVETYIIPKVALQLSDECIVEPQKNLGDYRVDGLFMIKCDLENVPGICLEIDENGHASYESARETQREDFVRSFGHRMIRKSIRRNATSGEQDQAIQDIVGEIRVLIKDMKTEYAFDMSEEEFVSEIQKRKTIDLDFARFFAKKGHERYGQFKYHHEDIADFLGYDKNNGERGGTHARRLLDLMKHVLTPNIHYIVDDGTLPMEGQGYPNPGTIRKGVKLHYWITRVGFYCICMASSKPRAVHYRHQFGEVYEFTINYAQALKNRLIRNLPNNKASEESISLRMKEKASHYKEKLDVANTNIKRLETETEKMKREMEKMQAELRRNEETIGDLMRKRWMEPWEGEDAPQQTKLKGINRTATKQIDEFMTWVSALTLKPLVVLKSTRKLFKEIDELNSWLETWVPPR